MTDKEFKYMKEGLTCDLASLLMEEYGLDMQSALTTLYESDTYSKISNPATGLYFHGSRYVYSYLHNEIRSGMTG